jgi:hypothetical protein
MSAGARAAPRAPAERGGPDGAVIGLPASSGSARASAGPKTKWRPAFPPASTVPGQSALPVKARPPFPGRFRPRPCGPGRSLRFLRRDIATPVPVPAGSAPCLAAGFGSLAGPFVSALRLRTRVPYRASRKRNFFDALSRFLPPEGFRSAGPSKESGFGLGSRRCLALLPSGCPDLASFDFGSCELPSISARPCLGASFRFR